MDDRFAIMTNSYCKNQLNLSVVHVWSSLLIIELTVFDI